MQLSSKLKDFINGPQGMAMGTRDADLRPDYSKPVGAQVLDDGHVKLFIPRKTTARAIENIKNNKLISVTMVSVLNYEAYQIKGKVVNYAEANEEEQAAVENYMHTFNEACKRVGLPDRIIYNWPHDPVWAIEIEVQEAFEQTPRIGTGNKVEISHSTL